MQSVYFKKQKTFNKQHSFAPRWFVPLYAVVFSLLLFMRDWGGMGVNKYLFVLITLVAVCSLDIKKTLCLFCFLMPLYVGLPGNYMTFIFLGKFLFEWKNFKFSSALFISTVFAATFVLLQNFIFDATSIAQMATIPGIIIVMFLFSYEGELDKDSMVIYYAAGVAITGLIMLLTTLNEFSFEEILSSSNRLGTGYNKIEVLGLTENMIVSLDPNYFGLFAIAAISVGYPLLFKKISKKQKVFLITSLLAIISVALIGLSRAFLLVFVAWVVATLLTQMSVKNILITLLTILIVAILTSQIFPEVIDALLERFAGDDMADGNGRITGINEYANLWIEEINTVLFGVGLYENTVHCMPLQVLFGGGIVYALIMLAFFFALVSKAKNKLKKKAMDYVPMLLTFVMTCTVPIATSLTFMFPFVMAIYSLKNEVNLEERR